MKSLAFVILLSSSLSFAANEAQVNISDVAKRVDTLATELREKSARQLHESINVKVPWENIDQRDAQFWEAALGAYDFLMINQRTERYVFMRNAIQASTEANHILRAKALKKWIEIENKRVTRQYASEPFYKTWKFNVDKINKTIEALEATRPNVVIQNNSNRYVNNAIHELQNIKQELMGLHVKSLADKHAGPTQKVMVVESPKILSKTVTQIIMGLAVFCCLTYLLGLVTRRKDKSALETKKSNKAIEPQLAAAIQIPTVSETVMNKIETEFNKDHKTINLETRFREVIEENQYLFEAAKLKVYPAQKSPFNTQVAVSNEELTTALSGLVKGTLALVNGSTQVPSHLEWKCKSQDGRIMLECTLHGVEYDSKSLYLNTIMEGDGSAPAYFGRTETILQNHLGSVGLNSANRRTTVVLGLEAKGTANYVN